MIKIVKNFIKSLAVITVVMSVSLTVSALEAEISGAGNRKFLLTGNIGKVQDNKSVAVMVYKPNQTADDITNENPLSALYHIGEAKTDNAGNFEYIIEVDGELDSFSDYSVVVSDYTGEEISLNAVAAPLEVTVDTAEFGHNYFDADTVNLDIKITDSSAMAESTQAHLKIYEREKNKLLYEKIYDSITIDETGIAAFVEKIDLNQIGMKYGVFKAELTVTADGTEDTGASTSFANIRKAEELNKKIGIQHHFGNGFTQTEQKEVVNLFADAGYGLARDNINWSFYEKTDDNFVMYDFVETYMDEAHESGIKMLMTSTNGNSLLIDEAVIVSETALAEYGEYVYNMVYDTVGRVSTYEIMNEVNHYEIAPEKKMTPEQYFKIVKVSSENAKAAAAQKSKDDGVEYKAEICAGALAYVTYDDADMNDWITELFNLGIGEYIDVFSHHIYTQDKKPEATSGKESVANKVRKIIDGYGYTDLPIILSEVGYSSTADYENSEYRQAIYEIRDLAYLYDKYDEIYLYCGVNKQNEDSEYERELGHLNTWYANKYNASGVAYSAKPVFVAMANFNALLANAKLVNKEHSLFSPYNYEFKTPDGNTVNMIWNGLDFDTTYEISTGTKNILVYDIYGNATEYTSENGVYKLNVGVSPIYVVDNTKALYVEDSEGNDVTALTDKVYLSANKDCLTEFGNAKVIIALYKGENRLKKCEYMDYSELLERGKMEISTSDADKLSIFIWNDFETMTPVKKEIEILKEER